MCIYIICRYLEVISNVFSFSLVNVSQLVQMEFFGGRGRGEAQLVCSLRSGTVMILAFLNGPFKAKRLTQSSVTIKAL